MKIIVIALILGIVLISGCVQQHNTESFPAAVICQEDSDCVYVSNYNVFANDPEGIPIPTEEWKEDQIFQVEGACVNLNYVDTEKNILGQDFIVDDNVLCECVEQSDVSAITNGSVVPTSTVKACRIKELPKPDMKLINITYELMGQQEINDTIGELVDFRVYYTNIGEAGCGEIAVQIEFDYLGSFAENNWLYPCAIDPNGDCFDPGMETYNFFKGFYPEPGEYEISAFVGCENIPESDDKNNLLNITISV